MGSAWVMLYHEVRDAPDDVWAVSPHQLAGTVATARERRLTLDGLAPAVSGERDAVSLTFDDAHRSVYEAAFPLLDSLGLTATVFVPIDRVERGGSGSMTWQELAELAAHGWAIESHGCSHRPLDQMSQTEAADEIRRSKSVIEDRLGRQVLAFAYPYGAVPAWTADPVIDELLQTAGYRFGFLAWGGFAPKPLARPFRIPREPAARGQQLAFAASAGDAGPWRG